MFGTLGGPEILLLLVLALIVFGPRKLPEIGKSMGKMLAEFRRASNDFRRTIEDEVEAEKMREAIAEQPSAAPSLPPPAPETVPDSQPEAQAAAEVPPPAGAQAEGQATEPVLSPPTESVRRE
jgi:Tat protein translocase TatB subunit